MAGTNGSGSSRPVTFSGPGCFRKVGGLNSSTQWSKSNREKSSVRFGLMAGLVVALSVLIGTTMFGTTPSAYAAGTFYVDKTSAACNDHGPGTEAIPYCKLATAVGAVGGPGTTIFVKPGTYREQITVPVSGSPGNPFVMRSQGGPVVLDEADDFTSPAKWTQFAGDVYLASSVTWSPMQVFADGARLNISGAPPASLPTNSFTYVPGTGLYVNAGGGNPAGHLTYVGRRFHGFVLAGRSWVTIDGFTITRCEDNAIFVFNGSNNSSITHNVVTLSNSDGITLSGCSNLFIGSNSVGESGNHGIALQTGVTNSIIQDNDCYMNARVSKRAANGIYVYGSPDNRLLRNRVRDNQDTGIEIQSGSNNIVSVQNISWKNGDHGFEHLYATGTLHVGDVAWGNFKDGFSIEGFALGTKLYNCIAADNGLVSNEFNLYVDSTSTGGFTGNYNMFHNSTTQDPVKYDKTKYSTVAAYSAASGQDAQSLGDDPRFVNADAGNFHLLAGSPAIDAGNSSVAFWSPVDAEGNARVDDPATPNTGAGTVTFADRGALEFMGTPSAGRGDGPSPTRIALSNGFPNPSVGHVAFTLDLPRATRVDWSVLDLQGRSVWSESRELAAGRVTLDWKGVSRAGTRTAPGMYLARVKVAGESLMRPFVVLK